MEPNHIVQVTLNTALLEKLKAILKQKIDEAFNEIALNSTPTISEHTNPAR